MEFVGPVTPGGPDITLSGSAKDIYEQIIELNPSYDVFDFPEYADALEFEGLNRENIETANLTTRNPSRDAEETLAKRGDGVSFIPRMEISIVRANDIDTDQLQRRQVCWQYILTVLRRYILPSQARQSTV
jgi:hypothetical protein